MPPSRRRGPLAWISEIANRLSAGRPAIEIDVLRVWALPVEPTV